MGFLDKAKSAAEQAAQKAKEGAEAAVSKTKETADDVQTKRELSKAYDDLGRTTYALIESGDVAHEQLTPLAVTIRDLEARRDDESDSNERDAAEGTPTAAT
jgi:hypothetical protein